MKQLTWTRWKPLTHPRRLWVQCSVCRFSTINEDKHLREWQESVGTPRAYRCPDCSSSRATQ